MSDFIFFISHQSERRKMDKLLYMEALKKESKQVNEDFWNHYDKLKQESKMPENIILDEAYRFAKRESS
jgi:hypothetical protein